MNETKTLPVGLTVNDKTCNVCVWAPNAKAVAIAGTFNDWNKTATVLQNDPNRHGHWVAYDLPMKAGDEYLFAITTQADEVIMRADPRARRMTNSVGNSVVYPNNYDWQADDFKMPSWNELVIYELHIGTFNVTEAGKPGTFATAIDRLEYLVDMGINCIEVMPISEFAGDFSWGYNPAHPYAVEEAYGGPDGFKDFVKAAHAKGIAVILDVVYNHFGPSDLAIWQFDGWSENDKGGIYFYNDWRSDTPWGDTRPDYGRPEVSDYIHDNAMMWLDEFRCDGLRMDMIPYMRHVKGDENASESLPEGVAVLQRINTSVNERFPGRLTIAEDLHGNNFITDDQADGGCGFGSQWDADFVHPVRAALIEQEDTNRSMESLSSALLRRYGDDFFKRVVYTESHDEVANGNARIAEEIAADDVNNYWSVKRAGLGAAMVLTTPGIPMLFQGQALLEDKWFSDQDPLDWSRKDEFSGVFNQYQDLIRLRRNLTGRTRGLQGQHTQPLVINERDKILAYVRWYDDPQKDGVLVVLNFSNTTYNGYAIGMNQASHWELLFNGDWKGYSDFNANADVALKLQSEEIDQDGYPHRVITDIGPYGSLIFGICAA
ncbi:alpha-amylase family glycosyl hydrolase [Neolewinella antarctica]|uniref:1,4-alpha-glucan branching enzyme n=1 Tax=Neolewinella antarctica TaxID=442734 RepID=A0ABX0X7U5_9BACT|nr:alpha-amylase family glycosyl hydrolase [Neolewinella antarctica]NJC25071.1 1,4-alpha-glucan branching enzyme [Neolewinella antarctica]